MSQARPQQLLRICRKRYKNKVLKELLLHWKLAIERFTFLSKHSEVMLKRYRKCK